MFSFFRKSNPVKSTLVDIHSHLLPGIDDGVNDIDESMDVIKAFVAMGYRKLITTPHIMSDFYANTPDIIRSKLLEVQKRIKEEGIDIEIEAAAEYYLDEYFVNLLEEQNELLTFSDNYLLFETGFMNEPAQLKEVVFVLKSNGYQPVMAHPERYLYLHNNFELIEDLVQRGVLLQINAISLVGYYSKPVKKLAEKLIDKEMISFVGSDCHNFHYANALRDAMKTKHYNKALDLDLLNYRL